MQNGREGLSNWGEGYSGDEPAFFTGSPKTYTVNWFCRKTQQNLGCNAVLIIRNKLPCRRIFNLCVGITGRRHPLHKKGRHAKQFVLGPGLICGWEWRLKQDLIAPPSCLISKNSGSAGRRTVAPPWLIDSPRQCLLTDPKSYRPLYCNEDIKLSLYMSCSPCSTANSFIMAVGHAWWQTLWHLAFDFICHITVALNVAFVRKCLLWLGGEGRLGTKSREKTCFERI